MMLHVNGRRLLVAAALMVAVFAVDAPAGSASTPDVTVWRVTAFRGETPAVARFCSYESRHRIVIRVGDRHAHAVDKWSPWHFAFGTKVACRDIPRAHLVLAGG